MTRGIKHDVDRFVSDMQAQYSHASYKLKDGRDAAYVYQWAMRPIQLWECVVKKEDLPDLMATIPIAEKGTKKQKAVVAMMRKSLGADKVPEDGPKGQRRAMYTHNVAAHVIGVKDDVDDELGNEML